MKKINKQITKLVFNDNIVAKNPEIIGVCHPSWRGIKAATYGLTPDVFEVSEIKTKTEADKIAAKILKYQPKKIVLSGYPSGYDLLAKALKTKNSSLRIFFLSHAPFTWYFDKMAEVSWLENMFKAYKEGYIEKIGFVKKDPAVYFKEQGVNTFFVMNRLPKFAKFNHVLKTKNKQIGIWGAHMWHRNLLNQTLGALMIKDSTAHLNELSEYFFLDKKRVKRHGIIPKDKYQPLLQSMDVNLYISFTDCFPMTIIESMSYGIPCIASDTSEIYNWSPYLREMLLESKIDSPVAIRDRITKVLKDYKTIQKEMVKYLPILNKEIEKSIKAFLK